MEVMPCEFGMQTSATATSTISTRTPLDHPKGSENKLALYFTHDWDVTNKLNLYYGARLEWQKLKGENAAVKNAKGEFVGRFADYYLGATAPDKTKIAPARF